MTSNKLKVGLLTLACSIGAAAWAADASSDALDALLRQADYWENNQRPDLARQALERYVEARPNSPEIIYRLAMRAREEGRTADAERWSARLEALIPGDQRIEELNNVSIDETISQVELARARSLAADGRYDDAIVIYRGIFGERQPSRALAPEFYQTLAGTANGWNEARTQLQRLVQSYPEDQGIARAYAEVLTYRENTRREGIDRLAAMIEAQPQVRAPWRQALIWLEARQADKARYDRYMARYPDDAAVMARFEQGSVVDRRQNGYVALEEGSLDAAEAAFRAALRVNANDVDAQAGLGLVALRRQNFSEAVQWLDRAMRAAPSRRGEWQTAYTTASYYANLNNSSASNDTNLQDELARVRALGNRATPGTRLIEADILRRLGDFAEAETIYREVLSQEPTNDAAQLGLVDVLRDRAATETPFTAETTLRGALRLRPEHQWVRVDLARLLYKEGNVSEAERVLEPLTNFEATAEQRAIAASLFAELQDWSRVQSLISSIHPDDRTPEIAQLIDQARVRQQFERVTSLLEQERTAEAQLLLDSLYDQESLRPGMAGQLALALNEMGRSDLALRWVQRDLSRDGDKLPSEYGNHVLVLAQLDRNREADNLMTELRRAAGQRADERDTLMAIRHGLAVIRADKLREAGQLASAYDQLAQPLREAPEDETLLLAMARVYSSGERHNEAQQIYNYVLEKNVGSVPALEGAIQAALASGNTTRAGELVERYRLDSSNNPEHLILAARVAQQDGDDSRALELLRVARTNVPNVAEVAPRSDGNPFRDQRTSTGSNNLSWLPGREPDDFYSTSLAEEDAQTFALVRRIDTMVEEINNAHAPRFDAGIELNVRSGESGMSQLERLEGAPLTISGSPLGNGRLAFEATPALLNSGDVDDSPQAQARFGRNALPVAAGELGGQSEQLDQILASIGSTAIGYFTARQRADEANANPDMPFTEKLRLEGEANAAKKLFEDALKRNPVYEAGIRLEGLTEGQKQTLARYFGTDVLATDGLRLSDTALEAVNEATIAAFENSLAAMEEAFRAASEAFQSRAGYMQPDYQRGAGMGLALRYTNGSFGVDVGSTPLGFEETNFVGGIQWQPALTPRTVLNLRLEQRAVKDSILSYGGVVDPYSGETWGGVVKRGGGAGIAYQSERGNGVYADLAMYDYVGNNVADNKQVALGVGGYVRAFSGRDSYLQTGIHLNAMGFSDDLSYFTYGHGGYFSPQEFFSLAFPINYVSDDGRLRYQLSLTPGYQSFSLDGNDYFPTDPESQELLNIFAMLGAIPNSRYEGNNENGIGVSAEGRADYRLSPNMSVGGSLGFSSFGAFNDYAFKLYLQYSKGDVR